MNKISQADLIGYVLGALDAHEEQLITDALKRDVGLRERLSLVEEDLANLPDRFVEIDPPKGLADKTINTISIVDASLKGGPITDGLHADSSQRTNNQSDDKPTLKKATFSSNPAEVSSGKKSGWSLIDMIVGCAICFIIATILFPSIASSRFQSDLICCQNNLRQVGYNLASIADVHDGRLYVARRGNQIDLGQYVKHMLDAELTADPNELICPSDPEKARTVSMYEAAWFRKADDRSDEHVQLLTVGTDTNVRPIVDHKPNNSSDSTLLQAVSASCGSYGFAVPAMLANRKELEAMRIPSSTQQVLCGDAPCHDAPGFQSRNHGGKGQNVLYGDLSVDYIVDTAYLPSGDHIYLNNQGEVQPGYSYKDNLIASGTIYMEEQR